MNCEFKEVHPYIQFTMEASTDNRLPFMGLEIIKLITALKLAFTKNDKQSSLLSKILHRTSFFFQESNNLNGIFLKLRYPVKLINSTIHNFQHSSDPCQPPLERPSDSPLRVTIPIKYHKICRGGSQTTSRPRKKDQPRSRATFYKQKDHWLCKS